MVNVTFESASYNVREGSDKQVQVCVVATDPRIKSQQKLYVRVANTTEYSASAGKMSYRV